MATADTVSLSEMHPPKEESIKVYNQIEKELKSELIKLRHMHDKHEPEYFAAAKDLSNHDLAGFSEDNFEQVRTAPSAYGIHLFGKIRIPALSGDAAYIHFRAWSAGPDEEAKFHSFHTEETEKKDGDKVYRAIFKKGDKLEWFDS